MAGFIDFFAIEQQQREAAEQEKKAANNGETVAPTVVDEKPMEPESSRTDVPIKTEPIVEQPSLVMEPETVPEIQMPVSESKTDDNNTVEPVVTETVDETEDAVVEESVEPPTEEERAEQKSVAEQTVIPDDVILEEPPDIPEPVRPKSVVDSAMKVPKRGQVKPSVTKSGPKAVSSTVQVQNFPRELMDAVREQVPGSTNNSDALAAFVYFKLGQQELVVPQKIKDLAAKCEGDHQVENMALRLDAMEQQMRGFGAIMQELELGIAYFIFDRLGFRRNTPKDARSIDFLENGVLDTRDRLREMQSQVRKRDLLKKGRPIR